jgi:hypothetical protein
MIRPEAAATLNRLREVLAGALMVGIGGWLLLKPGYVLPLVGMGLAALGAGLAIVGLRRLWFRADGHGPGVVQVIEGQVGYFGPADGTARGGFVALDDLIALSLTADGAHWRLTSSDGVVLVIPRAARGAEDLLDAFVRLPGVDPAALVRAASAGPAAGDRRLWQRGPRLVALPGARYPDP